MNLFNSILNIFRNPPIIYMAEKIDLFDINESWVVGFPLINQGNYVKSETINFNYQGEIYIDEGKGFGQSLRSDFVNVMKEYFDAHMLSDEFANDNYFITNSSNRIFLKGYFAKKGSKWKMVNHYEDSDYFGVLKFKVIYDDKELSYKDICNCFMDISKGYSKDETNININLR